MMIAGMRVHIRPAEPEIATIRRSWGERLFGRPWRPFRATTQVTATPRPRRGIGAYGFSTGRRTSLPWATTRFAGGSRPPKPRPEGGKDG